MIYLKLSQIKAVNSPWFRCFLIHEPEVFLSQLTIPVLAINEELDLQVSASQNIPAIIKALKQAGNKDYTALILQQLNHLFQTCETGSFLEYGEIEETISPDALKVMSDWILNKIRHKNLEKTGIFGPS